MRHFEASGDFVGLRREALLKDIKAHPAWQEKEILTALSALHPKFGPEQKDRLLLAVPSTIISRFSGCRLKLGEAKHIMEGSRWLIPGTVRDQKETRPCSVQFEPFEGKLQSIDEL